MSFSSDAQTHSSSAPLFDVHPSFTLSSIHASTHLFCYPSICPSLPSFIVHHGAFTCTYSFICPFLYLSFSPSILHPPSIIHVFLHSFTYLPIPLIHSCHYLPQSTMDFEQLEDAMQSDPVWLHFNYRDSWEDLESPQLVIFWHQSEGWVRCLLLGVRLTDKGTD